MKADPAPATEAAATPAATAPAAATPAPEASTPASTPAPTATPANSCGSHQAGVGTAADGCDYSPNPHNVTKGWGRVYNNSNATTNATYALHQNPCNEHQENAMDCSFSPTI